MASLAPASPLSYAAYLRERELHCRRSAAANAQHNIRLTYLGFASHYAAMAEDVERDNVPCHDARYRAVKRP